MAKTAQQIFDRWKVAEWHERRRMLWIGERTFTFENYFYIVLFWDFSKNPTTGKVKCFHEQFYRGSGDFSLNVSPSAMAGWVNVLNNASDNPAQYMAQCKIVGLDALQRIDDMLGKNVGRDQKAAIAQYGAEYDAALEQTRWEKFRNKPKTYLAFREEYDEIERRYWGARDWPNVDPIRIMGA